MLLKTIISKYGASLSGPPSDPKTDMVYDVLRQRGNKEEMHGLLSYRRHVLEALSECKPFFLDHHAADMVDSFSDDLLAADEDFLRDIELPNDVVWIELDEQALLESKKARGAEDTRDYRKNYSLRGVLFDNRNPEYLSVSSFTMSPIRDTIVDPIGEFRIYKDAGGVPDLKTGKAIPIDSTMSFARLGPGLPEESARNAVETGVDNQREAFMLCYRQMSSRRITQE